MVAVLPLPCRELIDEHNYDPQELVIEIGATRDETTFAL